MSIKGKIKSLAKYITATSFLAMEVFAFIAFSFGANFILYGSLTLALMIILIIFSIVEIKKRGLTDFIYLLFPLFIFGIVTSLGVYMRAHANVGDFNIAELIFIPIALLSTSICGYLLAINKSFNIKTFLIVIYGALGLLTLINLIANIVNFGAFYTIIYRGYYMYYGGKRSAVPVNEMAYALEGLKFVEVKMSHYLLYPSILLTSSLMLFKVSPKKQLRDFLIFSGYSFIGLLGIILIPSLLGAIIVVMLLLIIGIMFTCYKVPKSRKIFKYALYALIIIFVIVFAIVLINNQSFASGIHNKIASNSILDRLFNSNRFAQRFNPMLDNVIGKNFLGFAVHYITDVYYETATYSGSIFFDTFMTSGVIGVAAMTFTIIYALKCFKNYFKNDNAEERIKATLLAFVLLYFAYACLFYEGEFGIYYYLNTPYYMSSTFILVIFIFSYVVGRKYFEIKNPEPKEETIEEQKNDEANNEPVLDDNNQNSDDEREAVIDEI